MVNLSATIRSLSLNEFKSIAMIPVFERCPLKVKVPIVFFSIPGFIVPILINLLDINVPVSYTHLTLPTKA